MIRIAEPDTHNGHSLDPFRYRERAYALRGAYIAEGVRRLFCASSRKLAAPGPELPARVDRPFAYGLGLRALTFHRF